MGNEPSGCHKLESRSREHAGCHEFFALDLAPVPALLTDMKGKILRANQPMADLLHQHLGHLESGKPIVAFVPLAYHHNLFTMLRSRVKTFGGKQLLGFRRHNEPDAVCKAAVSWVPSASANTTFGIWIFQDAELELEQKSRLGQLQTILDLSNARILNIESQGEDKLAELKQFNSQFIHELRSPLHSILGATEMLLEANTENSEQRELLKILHASVAQLRNIANSGLSLARKNQLRLEVHESCFNLRTLINSVLAQFQIESDLKSLELSAEIAPGVPPLLKSDRLLLSQVLSNLLSNSLKCTEKGGVRITVGLFDDSAKLLFSVTDTGTGLEEKYLDSLFEPFSKACNYYSQLKGGSGVGLFACKTIVEQLGGNISLENVPGSGCRILFTIPLLPADDLNSANVKHEQPILVSPEKNEKPASREPLSSVQPLNVLIAEDNDLVAEVLGIQLKRLGCVTKRVENGQKAVIAASKECFDIIFMDCQMPVQDGYWAAHHIRTLENCKPDLPIVALSGNSNDEVEQRCRAAGMTAFLTKPARMEELRQIVEEAWN